ncbi:MAG: PQQ-binding-like beta-propeller repeat protein, partial [Phycisphaerales bacterium]
MRNILDGERIGPRGAVLLAVSLCWFVFSSACPAVTSKITRHAGSADLLKGEAKHVVVGSRGTITLGRSSEVLAEQFEDVWSINSVVVSGGTVYVGTSPNGGIYKYSLGKLTKMYPAESEEEPEEPPQSSDANTVEADEYLSNEHIFAMATDVSGRLLAGISGRKCRLCRFEGEKMEVIFEPNDAKYIFAIAIDNGGNIYLATGPEGKLYRTDPFGREGKVIYDSPDKNILSLATTPEGFVFAGADTRGLVYKIDPENEKATVLYDSDQPEVTALLFEEAGNLYAAATTAKVVQTQTQFAAQLPRAGRPEAKDEKAKSTGENDGGMKLKIPNTAKAGSGKSSAVPPQARKGAKPAEASHIYKITPDGFVTDLFGENAVFFCLAKRQAGLFVGTGNDGRLFQVDPASEQQAVIYEDEESSQITAIAVSGDDVYAGAANPAKLIKLGVGFASSGTYTSALIDAGQPARWGKLQIEADIPEGCSVLAACRSGNVKDVNDPTFSDWTDPVQVTEPVQLSCPLGRFCQYRLTLKSSGAKSPVVREIAVAGTVPNLAPRVEAVSVARVSGPGKQGTFKITYKAEDDNKDKLIYRIDFRKTGRTGWIKLKDENEAATFDWDGKTVEDGRYEIRVTASDERSNTTATK